MGGGQSTNTLKIVAISSSKAANFLNIIELDNCIDCSKVCAHVCYSFCQGKTSQQDVAQLTSLCDICFMINKSLRPYNICDVIVNILFHAYQTKRIYQPKWCIFQNTLHLRGIWLKFCMHNVLYLVDIKPLYYSNPTQIAFSQNIFFICCRKIMNLLTFL